ncbi:MAG: hypothetical protein HY831_03165 [Candidatus Aenigmarchaeota archaeon]|nr:hypothetical protein [Candidatus Aenigmarchaeota archaeon]
MPELPKINMMLPNPPRKKATYSNGLYLGLVSLADRLGSIILSTTERALYCLLKPCEYLSEERMLRKNPMEGYYRMADRLAHEGDYK